MFRKFVVLNISCSKRPCQITILYDDGSCIKRHTITSKYTNICVYTKACSIKIIASYNQQVYYKTVYLNGLWCQNIFVNFEFNAIFSQRVVNIITLNDANYGFPISRAMLKFSGNIQIY